METRGQQQSGDPIPGHLQRSGERWVGPSSAQEVAASQPGVALGEFRSLQSGRVAWGCQQAVDAELSRIPADEGVQVGVWL